MCRFRHSRDAFSCPIADGVAWGLSHPIGVELLVVDVFDLGTIPRPTDQCGSFGQPSISGRHALLDVNVDEQYIFQSDMHDSLLVLFHGPFSDLDWLLTSPLVAPGHSEGREEGHRQRQNSIAPR